MLRISMTSGWVLAISLVATAQAQVSDEAVRALGAPDRVETSIGTLDFKDGAPSADTAKKVFDALDFTRALNVYNNSFRGASALGFHKGFQSIGADYNDVVITSELLDSASLFLTGNADTVYYLSVIDLSKGPMVIEQPSDGVGTINDMWFSWIIDVGGPGPDRGRGGKYLIVGPDYDGPLPEGGYFIAHSKTNRILYASRAYLVNGDPKPAVENVKASMRIYPYAEGAYGTSIAQALTGAVRLGEDPKIPDTKFIEASNLSFNTIPPSDFGFYEWINENVQAEPATSYDVELSGQLAAIGIVKGQDFAPDERMKKILSDAAAVGQAAGRVLNWRPYAAHPDWAYYPDSKWGNMLWEGGAFFETPPPAFEDGKFKPLPPTGARTLDFAHGLLLRLHARQSRHDHEHSWRRITVSDGLPGFCRRCVRRRENLQGDAAQGYPGQGVLVLDGLRQPDPVDVADAPEVSARRLPELSFAGGDCGRGRLNHGLVQPRTAGWRGSRQLDSDRSRQGLVHHPAALQPASVVLRQVLADQRN